MVNVPKDWDPEDWDKLIEKLDKKTPLIIEKGDYIERLTFDCPI